MAKTNAEASVEDLRDQFWDWLTDMGDRVLDQLKERGSDADYNELLERAIQRELETADAMVKSLNLPDKEAAAFRDDVRGWITELRQHLRRK